MNISTFKETADYEWAIQLNRFWLDAIGLWPADYCRARQKFFTTLRAMLSFMLVVLSCTIPCCYSLIVNRNDLILFIENLGYCIPILLSHLKFVIVYKKKKLLLSIINIMAEDWAKSMPNAEKLVMIRRAHVGRIIALCLYILTIFSIFVAFILPRFGITIRYVTNGTDVRRTFPVPVYYAQNAYRSPYYEMLIILQLTAALMTACSYAGVDHFLVMLIFHVCGQLENLRARIANVRESEHFDRILTTIVEDHVRLVRVVNVIENTFTLLFLIILLHSIIFACVFGLLLLAMLADTNNKSLIRTACIVCTLINTLAQTFYYCFAGQILTTQFEGLYDAVYESDWLSLKSKEAKSLILIMARTMAPLYITAGKLFPMTMLTFCNILKISLSYISFFVTKL